MEKSGATIGSNGKHIYLLNSDEITTFQKVACTGDDSVGTLANRPVDLLVKRIHIFHDQSRREAVHDSFPPSNFSDPPISNGHQRNYGCSHCLGRRCFLGCRAAMSTYTSTLESQRQRPLFQCAEIYLGRSSSKYCT